MKHKAAVRTVLYATVVSIVFAAVFGLAYMNDRAWGANGDDSAGYIYLAGRLFSGLPLVYHDPLGAEGLAFFGDEHLARWLIPTHHQFINPSGTVASKYPIGLSLLMAGVAKLMHSADGFYVVNPLLATANIVLMYLVALCAFATYRYRHIVGMCATVGMGVSSVYYDYALAQPMREIPSITFLLLTMLALFWFAHVWKKNRKIIPVATIAAGLAFGMAVNVRETSVVVLPAVTLFVWLVTRQYRTWTLHVRALFLPVLLFLASMIIAVLPTIQNSVSISKEKVVFKARDTSRVVLLSNIGHVKTLSLQNVFNNNGKFRPGTGALPDYWNVMRKASPIHFFIVCVGVGFYFLWRESRETAALLGVWLLGILGIFSLWVNPYSRYVLPLFPPLFLFGAYGLAQILTTVIPSLWRPRWARMSLTLIVVLIVGFAYAPVVSEAKNRYVNEVHVFKAISEEDLRALQELGTLVGKTPQSLLMFSGAQQYGTSETFEAHTGVKAVRFPLDQRFIFDPVEVNAFFDQIMSEGYDISIWVDSSSSAEAVQWLADHNATSVYEHDFSFRPDVHVYHVTQK